MLSPNSDAISSDAIDHCQTTRSILRNEADKAGISPECFIIPADGETTVKTSRKGLLFALTDGGFGEGDFDYGGAVETGGYGSVEMSHMVWKKSFTQQA